jgi:hypothetical protein
MLADRLATIVPAAHAPLCPSRSGHQRPEKVRHRFDYGTLGPLSGRMNREFRRQPGTIA